MILVFLAADHHTLLTKHVDHVHITETDDEEDQMTYYEAAYFFLDGGMLVLATSAFAQQKCGRFLGVIADDGDPESLREAADSATIAALNAARARMQ